MSRLIFKTIAFKNIKSYGNDMTTINLNEGELNLIAGKNGTGKSTILESIYFNLFGQGLNKIKKGELVNNINKKKLLTELTFSANNKEYKVIRGIKPDVFEIYEDDKMLDQDSSVILYQKRLVEILKIDAKTFYQMVLLNSKYSKFLELTSPDRRDLISNILCLDIFKELNEKVKLINSKTTKAHTDLTHKMDITKRRIEDFDKFIDNTTLMINVSKNNDNSVKIAEQETLLVIMKEEIVTLKATYDTLSAELIDCGNKDDLNAELTELKSRVEKGSGLLYKHQSDYEHVVNEREFVSDNTVCPTCNQDIDAEFKSNIITKCEASEVVLTEKLLSIRQRISGIKDQLKTKSDTVTSINEIDYKINSNNNLLRVKEEKVISIAENIVTLSESTVDNTEQEKQIAEYKEKVKTFNDELEAMKKEKLDIESKLEIIKKMLFYLSDKGIKSTIIDKYVDIINERVNYYLNKLGFNCVFKIDNMFNDVITKDNMEMNYSNLSYGQKSRTDLALLLTWLYVGKINNSVSTNLLFLDEIVDASGLDKEGVADLLNLLKDQSNMNIFIISHQMLSEEMFDKTFTISTDELRFTKID